MKKYKIYTIALLLFTVSTFASCVNNPKTTTKATAKEKTTVTAKEKATTKAITKKEIQDNTVIRKVDAKTFKTEIEGKKIQLVDVRTPKEYKQGHIENSDNVNVMDKNFMVKMSKYNKDQAVYVYCRSGGRSMRAASKLKSAGYNVVNLNGGIIGWAKNGFKTVK